MNAKLNYLFMKHQWYIISILWNISNSKYQQLHKYNRHFILHTAIFVSLSLVKWLRCLICNRYTKCIIEHNTVYPKKYAHGFVVLCFVVVMQSFIMNSHEVFIHIHQGCFAGTGAIVRLPQCQWSKPDGYDKISQCITTTKHSKAKNRVHISWDILYESIQPAIQNYWRTMAIKEGGYCLTRACGLAWCNYSANLCKVFTTLCIMSRNVQHVE